MMSDDEIIIRKIIRGDVLGPYDGECAAIRKHIRQLEADIKFLLSLAPGEPIYDSDMSLWKRIKSRRIIPQKSPSTGERNGK